MNEPPTKRLTAAQARALWERALEMQLEAARRAEERALSSGVETDPGADDWGFTAEEVAAAASEAGISAEFMDAALAELQVARKSDLGPEGGVDRAADRLLLDPRKAIEVSRQIAGSPEEVLEAIRDLFSESPFFLTLKDVRGDPLDDGVLVFQAPKWGAAFHHQTPFVNAMLYGDLDLLFFTVRGPKEETDAPPRTEVVIRAPLRKSRRSHWWWAVGLGGTTTLGGGLAGLTLGLVIAGAALAPPLAAAVGLGAGAAAAGGVGAGNVWAFRRLFRWGIGKAEQALDDLLSAVDVRLRYRGGFRIPDPARKARDTRNVFPLDGM